MSTTRLIVVGGFLGAGKTTLLAAAAERLERAGLNVGVITNDQADDLVDTAVLADRGLDVREVSGGCFCCRFSCLLSASELLADESERDVLLAEPVGSCTDISATVLQPLKRHFASRFSLAPYSVLVDPLRLQGALDEPTRGLAPNVLHIFRSQLAEADFIVLNKTDLLSPAQLSAAERLLEAHFPDIPVVRMSAATGRGVAGWLARVLDGAEAGRRLAAVDYDVYAAGEAALGWLNAAVELQADDAGDWAGFVERLMDRLWQEFRSRREEIAHVKLRLSSEGGELRASLTSGDAGAIVHGELSGRTRRAHLILNARVQADPDALREAVEACIRETCGTAVRARVERLAHFSPARPQPTHRFDRVVGGA